MGENCQVIDLGSRATHYNFKQGVALGVYYGALREFEVFSPRSDLLKEVHCHWRSMCMWQPLTFGPELRVWLETEGLPLLDNLSDDSSGMESWRGGPVDGLHETARLLWLSLDLAPRGASAELSRALDRLEEIASQLSHPDFADYGVRIREVARKAREMAGLSS